MPKTKIVSKAPADAVAKEKKVNVKPLMGYLLVEPSEAESRTTSGLYLPETAQEKPAQGRVIAVGDDIVFDMRVIKCPVNVGDKVIYKKWGGDEIKVGGREMKIVKFEDLMAVVED